MSASTLYLASIPRWRELPTIGQRAECDIDTAERNTVLLKECNERDIEHWTLTQGELVCPIASDAGAPYRACVEGSVSC